MVVLICAAGAHSGAHIVGPTIALVHITVRIRTATASQSVAVVVAAMGRRGS